MATVKAALGCNFMMDIQKFKDESEDYLSHMWRHLVTVSRSIVGQFSCFQNAIMALQVCQFLLWVQMLIECFSSDSWDCKFCEGYNCMGRKAMYLAVAFYDFEIALQLKTVYG